MQAGSGGTINAGYGIAILRNTEQKSRDLILVRGDTDAGSTLQTRESANPPNEAVQKEGCHLDFRVFI